MYNNFVTMLFIVVNILNLVVLLPMVYPMFKLISRGCKCAVDFDLVIILLYFAITLCILIGSLMTRLELLDISNRSARVTVVIYFLLTFVFVEAATRYIKKKREGCECFKDEYKNWITSLTLVRWIGIYIFGLVFMSAGLYLFIRSEERPFSFPMRSYIRPS